MKTNHEQGSITINFVNNNVLIIPANSLMGWNFEGQNLHRAIMDDLCLDEAHFADAHLRNTSLIRASLVGADFSRAAMMCAYLDQARLMRCNFRETRPFYASFVGAFLQGADFSDADVHGARFTRANLCGANLRFARYEECDFQQAIYDEQTRWPEGFEPQRWGAVPVSPLLLHARDLPEGFSYPAVLSRLIEQNLVDFTPWIILSGENLKIRYDGLKARYPERTLIPFARREDNDDVACWEAGEGETVFIVHDFASPGWEQHGTFDCFTGWLHNALDATLAFDD